jgi:hypothetical protein
MPSTTKLTSFVKIVCGLCKLIQWYYHPFCNVCLLGQQLLQQLSTILLEVLLFLYFYPALFKLAV